MLVDTDTIGALLEASQHCMLVDHPRILLNFERRDDALQGLQVAGGWRADEHICRLSVDDVLELGAVHEALEFRTTLEECRQSHPSYA